MVQAAALVSGLLEAPMWKRLVAVLVDFGIGVGIVFAVSLGATFAGAHGLARLVSTVLTVAYWWIFCPYMESSPYHATWGKLLLGVRVADQAGSPISFGRAIVRNLARGLVVAVPFVVLAVAVNILAVSELTAGTWIAVVAILTALVFMLLPIAKRTPWDDVTRTRVLFYHRESHG